MRIISSGSTEGRWSCKTDKQWPDIRQIDKAVHQTQQVIGRHHGLE